MQIGAGETKHMPDENPVYSEETALAERRCVVCHSESLSRTGYKVEHEGKLFWLCSRACLKRFAQVPCRFECHEEQLRKDRQKAS